MTTLTQIQAPQGAFYLDEIPQLNNQLPYGIFNKKEPGCGMTHLALFNKQHYIVVVPRVELVKSKATTDRIQPVYGGIKKSEVLFYATYYAGTQKFICTYDSLPRLVSILKEAGVNPYSKFRLLVDEYHTFLDDYAFRRDALSGCLTEASKFEYVTYGSATPLTPTFTPSLLSGLPVTELIWPDTIKVNVSLKQTPKPYLQAVKVIKEYKTKGYYEIDGEKSYEAILFLNSVRNIQAIIKKADLTPDEVRVICGRDLRNKEVLGEFYEEKKHARFTFVTSAGYSGIDIESESALTFVFSSVEDSWKTVEISRALHQISGRVRTRSNPFYRRLVFFYSTGVRWLGDWFKQNPRPKSKDFGDTQAGLQKFIKTLEIWRTKARAEAYKRFKEQETALLSSAADTARQYNQLTRNARESTIKAVVGEDSLDENRYLNVDSEGNFVVDTFRFKRDEFAFEEVLLTYLDGFTLRQALKGCDAYQITKSEYIKFDNALEEKVEETASFNMRTALIEYLDEATDNERKEYLEQVYPKIRDWKDRLGENRLRGLSYNIKNIQQEYLKFDYTTLGAIRELITPHLADKDFISSKELKDVLQGAYEQVPLWAGSKPKASDITHFYPACKESVKRVNKSNTKGYTINLSLFFSY